MFTRKALSIVGAAVVAVIVIPALIGSCARRSPGTAGGAAPSGPSYGDCVIGDPIVDGSLAVYPVLNPRAAAVDVLTFDEAVAKGLVTVTERGGAENDPGGGQQQLRQVNERPRQTAAGQPAPQQEAQQTAQINVRQDGQTLQVQTRGGGDVVNTLLVENRGDKPVFIMAGEIVKGGRQDRTIAQDSIIPPHSGPVDINVFCVEHGRWQGQTAQFTSAKLCADNSVRQKALVLKGQSEVWQAVAAKNDKASAQPQTGTYLAAVSQGDVKKKVDERLARLLRRISGQAHVTGFVVAMNGTVVGADIFANPSICSKMQEKLLQSYVFDAETDDTAAGKKAPSRVEVAQLLNDVAAGKATIERNSRYGLNRANENDVAAIYVLQEGENGAKLHECLQRK